MADLCAKEAKDFDLHRCQTCDHLLHLICNVHPDTFDPFQHLEYPPQRRTICGLVDLIRDRLLLPCSLLAETPLRDRIDQQGEGHHHQKSLNTRGFFHKQ